MIAISTKWVQTLKMNGLTTISQNLWNYKWLDKDVFNRVKSFHQIDMDLFGYDASMQDNEQELIEWRMLTSTVKHVYCK